ncbi:2-methylaconitate cis-trans isomerase PrpF family protein [Peribacillus kribbensis]|uniref:2-methylaconitate cis-trans isomerase PrpF family protein n=1 Tax=Peribacillus kribbensis TaxID=356658 RepID=UPI00040EAC8C|nr:PrpF domain-containing protein [Peribacillus kribbensis]
MYDFGQVYKIPTVIMRGGTSKGLIVRKSDLPRDPVLRDEVLLKMYGSPDESQVDGLGGGTSLSSKLAIIGPPTHPDAHIDYTFGQVSLEKKTIDYNVTCGNFVTAVGLYAAEEGYVPLVEPITYVNIYNNNINKMIVAEIPVKNGQIQYEGDFVIDGVPGTSSRIMLNFMDSGGTFTGRTLPTNRPFDSITLLDGRTFEVSIIDCANVLVFVRAEDVGLKGTELQGEVNGNPEILDTLEKIRVEAGIMAGLLKEEDRHIISPAAHALPKIAVVTSPKDYITVKNKMVYRDEIDIVSRYITMGQLHRTHAVSGAMALAAAAKIPGTIPHQQAFMGGGGIRIGHPSGTMYVDADVEFSGGSWNVKRAANGRTARRLMEGYAHIPFSLLKVHQKTTEELSNLA